MKKNKQNFFNKFSESFLRSFLIVLAYGIAFGVGYITKITGNPSFTTSFYVSEQTTMGSFTLNLKDIIDLIIIGPAFSIISFFLIRRTINMTFDANKQDNKAITTAYFFFFIAIVMFNYGNMIHVMMNRVNSHTPDELRTNPLYYSIYFLDEIVGHLLLTLGFFIVFCEGVILHTENLSRNKEIEPNTEISGVFDLNSTEESINIALGIGLGLATGLIYPEGQCAFVFLILNPCAAAILYLISYRMKISIRDNSLLVLFLMMTIVYVITTLIYGFMTGFKSVYPFFYQISEL